VIKEWERAGKRVLTRAVGQALRARGPAGAMPDLADLDAVLLVRQQNQLGDMLLSTPLFRAVRERAPRARIDLLVAPPNVDAVRNTARCDEVLCYDKKALFRPPLRAKRFLERLRDARYDLALVVSTVSFSYTSVWLAALAGARWRAGRPEPGGAGRETAERVFHWTLPEPVPGRHQSAVNLDLVAPFGATSTDLAPEIFLTGAERAAGERALTDAIGAPGDGLRVLIHPGAGKLPNRWPAIRFGEVAAALRAEGHRVAVATGPSETGLFAGVDAGARTELPRLSQLPVREVGGAFAAADLALVNDTGVLHLAAAVGTPTLGLFGPTDPRQWCPASPAVRYLQAPGGALDNLATDTVRKEAVGLAAHLGAGAA
jgi:ADP-heptose:LPS heptosyltransferase